MILFVMIRPNSAFATIRDNDEKYIWWSVSIFGLSFVAFVTYGYSMPPELNNLLPSITYLTITYGILSELVFVTLTWLVGRVWGGNPHWRKVFSVLFCKNIVYILASAIIIVMWQSSSFTAGTPWTDSLVAISLFLPISPLTIILLGLIIWMIILVIKAIKVVHGFDTGKAVVVGIFSCIPIIAIGVFV
ncbi:MAG: hypothetical protein F4202_02855 [Cenarchaeum sp. SB0677_bin_16]|nr:hypothetical protein [Cenarchaeum sp. SB0677_bin_16]